MHELGGRSISVACVVLKSASTTTSLDRIFSGMPKSPPGGKTTAGVSSGDQVSRIAGLALKRGKSVDFTGYWQRHIAE